jgi:hypothetical protein
VNHEGRDVAVVDLFLVGTLLTSRSPSVNLLRAIFYTDLFQSVALALFPYRLISRLLLQSFHRNLPGSRTASWKVDEQPTVESTKENQKE